MNFQEEYKALQTAKEALYKRDLELINALRDSCEYIESQDTYEGVIWFRHYSVPATANLDDFERYEGKVFRFT